MRRITAVLIFSLLHFFAANLVAQISITPQISASQIIGVAPMPVFFDATQTSINVPSLNTFHDLNYQWNFGDFFSGAWHTKTTSKNRASSPLSAHIFDSTGLHVVELETFVNYEYSVLKTFIVKVQDAAEFYNGKKTVCFSTDGEFSDAPYEAQLITIQDLSDVQPYINDSTRLLFKRGDTFQTNTGLDLGNAQYLTIGAFGARLNVDEDNRSENAPILLMNGQEPLFLLGNKDTLCQSFNVKITELTLQNNNPQNLYPAIFAEGETSKNLLYRLKIEDFAQAIFYDYEQLEYTGYPDNRTVQPFQEIIISDCIINNRQLKGDLLHLNGKKIALIGNQLNNFNNEGHVLKISWGHQVIINNNHFYNPGKLKNTLNISAPKCTFCITEQAISTQIIIADNHFETQKGVRDIISICKSSKDEGRIEDVIIDRNFMTALHDDRVRCGILIGANRATIKNNIINGTGANRWKFTGIRILNNFDTLGSIADVKITHNTIFKEDWVNLMTGVKVGENIQKTMVINNLVYCPEAMDLSIVDDKGKGTVEKRNIYPIVHPFIAQHPIEPIDFQLDSISVLLDGGIAEQLTCRDYFENIRSQNDRIDVGAFQFTATPITSFKLKTLNASNILEYPHPIRSYFTMDLSKLTSVYSVEIFDSEGHLIHVDKKQQNMFYTWQTQHYESGIYWLKISSKNATLMTKVLIQN